MKKTERWACPDGEWTVEMLDENGEYDGYRPRRFWDGHPEFIRMYTEGPCAQIQGWLRAGKKDYKASLNFHISLSRLIRGLDRELSKRLAAPKQRVYRMDNGYLESTLSNGEMVDKGYLSTTTDTSVFSWTRKYLYIIDCDAPAGAMVDDLSHYDEKEYLFQRGSRFVVTGEKWAVKNNMSIKTYYLKYKGRA